MFGFVIAGVSSGSGKTTITNGLLRAFARKGLSVAPFKVGPDYIDTQFHHVAAGVPSVNLDLFMSGESHVGKIFHRYSKEKDLCVVEGVMGLFDGYDRDKGSAAEIARILDLPVILVINAQSSGYSLAALLSGFKNYDKRIKIAGVIFNNVASENHLQLLKNAAEDAGVSFLGAVRRNAEISVPSRHLGLSLETADMMEHFVARAEMSISSGVDLDKVLDIVREGSSLKSAERINAAVESPAYRKNGRIAVAYDDAFNFMYQENLRALEENHRFGGEIVKFSPLCDARMPEADFLYLPGGYPELYSSRLAANHSMKRSIKEYIEDGGYVLAECGGMLYLGEKLGNDEMCGVLPLNGTMAGARLHLGYRKVKAGNFRIGGHEFHYSSVIEDRERIKDLKCVATQSDVKGNEVDTPFYRYRNAIASYTHLYWGDNDISGIYENLHAKR